MQKDNFIFVIALSRMKRLFKKRFPECSYSLKNNFGMPKHYFLSHYIRHGIPKVIFVLILLSGLGYGVIALWGCAKREIKNIDSKGTTIVCFGDSLTFGYGANPGEDFPRALSQITNIPVINSGLDGDTSDSALKRLKTDILDRDPLLVIIEFGGNDFLRKIPLEHTLKNIEEMIKEVQSAGAMAAIADISISMIMDDYRKGFKHLCKKYNAIYIPQLLKGILTNPSLKSDFIHPNAEGYKVIAQRIYRHIITYLNRNSILRQFKKQ